LILFLFIELVGELCGPVSREDK